MVEPRMIAFFRRCSWPLISFRSSGIDVKPRSAKRTTPNGAANIGGLNVARFEKLIEGKYLMKVPITITIIIETPKVSIRFRPFSPRFRSSVKIIQKNTANTTGGVSPGISWDRDSPSPIR